MKQEITRAHDGWALDNVTLHNEVTRYTSEEVKSAPHVRTHIHTSFFLLFRLMTRIFVYPGRSLRARPVLGRRGLGQKESHITRISEQSAVRVDARDPDFRFVQRFG